MFCQFAYYPVGYTISQAFANGLYWTTPKVHFDNKIINQFEYAKQALETMNRQCASDNQKSNLININ